MQSLSNIWIGIIQLDHYLKWSYIFIFFHALTFFTPFIYVDLTSNIWKNQSKFSSFNFFEIVSILIMITGE